MVRRDRRRGVVARPAARERPGTAAARGTAPGVRPHPGPRPRTTIPEGAAGPPRPRATTAAGGANRPRRRAAPRAACRAPRAGRHRTGGSPARRSGPTAPARPRHRRWRRRASRPRPGRRRARRPRPPLRAHRAVPPPAASTARRRTPGHRHRRPAARDQRGGDGGPGAAGADEGERLLRSTVHVHLDVPRPFVPAPVRVPVYSGRANARPVGRTDAESAGIRDRQLGIEVGQRHQHERPLPHPGVRDHEVGLVDPSSPTSSTSTSRVRGPQRSARTRAASASIAWASSSSARGRRRSCRSRRPR